MSLYRPKNADEMLAWLRAHEEEPFFALHSGDRLIIGTRNDEGELCAYDCHVEADRYERVAPTPDPRDAALRGLVEAARGLMLAVVHDVGPTPYESDIRKVLDALRAAEIAMGGERHG